MAKELLPDALWAWIAPLLPLQATVATAHAIARVVYRVLKYQVEFEPLSDPSIGGVSDDPV